MFQFCLPFFEVFLEPTLLSPYPDCYSTGTSVLPRPAVTQGPVSSPCSSPSNTSHRGHLLRLLLASGPSEFSAGLPGVLLISETVSLKCWSGSAVKLQTRPLLLARADTRRARLVPRAKEHPCARTPTLTAFSLGLTAEFHICFLTAHSRALDVQKGSKLTQQTHTCSLTSGTATTFRGHLCDPVFSHLTSSSPPSCELCSQHVPCVHVISTIATRSPLTLGDFFKKYSFRNTASVS